LRLLWLEFGLVLLALIAISASATVYVNHSGWTLYYGDAEAHLDIARRVVDSRKPGYDQLGTVWLPLPHALMLPLVRNDGLWRSGLAGAIPSSVCFVCAGVFLYAAMRRAAHSSAVALASLGLLVFNPNLLYLQAIPMSETVFLAAVMALLYFTIRFRDTHSLASVAGAGLATLAAALSRYEGWFVIPFVALYFAITARGYGRITAPLLYAVLASLGPLYWLAHNWWLYSNPLEFYNGPYSAMSIYRRALAQNMAAYRGDHDWRAAALYYGTALRLCAGWPAIVLGIGGLAVAALKRVFWPILLVLVPPLFYLWSMHSGGTPIFVPTLWPFSYYNTRYATAALPLLAVAGGCLVLFAPLRFRLWAATAVLILASAPWLIRPQPNDWITWKEAQVNSRTRRAWTKAASSELAGMYHHGDGILTSFGDLTGILREAAIPLREALYEGDDPAWMAATTRPDLALHEEWAVAFAGDVVARAAQRNPLKAGPHYHLVETVKVRGAPVIDIYKRD